MPGYEITIYLDNGARFAVRETAQNIDEIKDFIFKELKEAEAFTLNSPTTSIVILNKRSIIGYTIYEV